MYAMSPGTIAACLRVEITVCLRITITVCLCVSNRMTHTFRTNNSIYTMVCYLYIPLNRKFNIKKDGISLTSMLCCVQVSRRNISINEMLHFFFLCNRKLRIKLLYFNY